MGHKILIVEDESNIRRFLKINFERNGYTVIEAESGEEGIIKARREEPQIVILDVMLPGMDGFKVCEALRKEFSSMGIVMLTARSQDADKITGLENGADDYLVKPFNTAELILRVKALSRRLDIKNETKEHKRIKSGPFTIDIYAQEAFKQEAKIELTPTEYVLLKLFMENEGKAFHRDELLDMVWGRSYMGDPKVVDVNIRRLRAKIEDSPVNPTYIVTIWGIGYKWAGHQIK
ncbi:response regulator transcription factor [Petroclostridium sp. X23]|uniref:response regulator transcription factor n=1 Tax=Petroclostridium sp. X23 TaxID=3045146 RepID=UPI0024AD943D|nr:response regulator transcription factor [Petroclostridium sp. X23]WHH58626.1 response regulator transcription factor [Petroclostridium sp. X23]